MLRQEITQSIPKGSAEKRAYTRYVTHFAHVSAGKLLKIPQTEQP